VLGRVLRETPHASTPSNCGIGEGFGEAVAYCSGLTGGEVREGSGVVGQCGPECCAGLGFCRGQQQRFDASVAGVGMAADFCAGLELVDESGQVGGVVAEVIGQGPLRHGLVGPGLAATDRPPEVDVVTVNDRLTVRFTVPAAAFALVGSAGWR